MLLTLPRATLLDALSVASTPVDSSASQPILQTVRLTMLDGLDIVGTDLVTTVVAHLNVTGTPGGCCVNARTLSERVKLMPEGDVKLTLSTPSAETGTVLVIEGGKRRFSMAVRDAVEFPKGVDVRDATGEPVPAVALAALLDRGASAMSDDRGAQAVTRVAAFSTIEDGWTEIGSASTREAASSAAETGLAASREVLIPHRGVEVLRRFLSGKGEVRVEVAVAHGAGSAAPSMVLYASRETATGRLTLCIQLADGRIVPPSGHQYRMFYAQTEAMSARTIMVSRVAALESLTAVSSASELHQVTIHAADNRLKISARATEVNENASDEIACTMASPNDVISVILSGDSICKILALATSERVSIRVANEDPRSGAPMPVIVKEIGELEARAWWLTMPMLPRVSEKKPEPKRKKKADANTDVAEVDPNEMEE